jgi:hypothetical protein
MGNLTDKILREPNRIRSFLICFLELWLQTEVIGYFPETSQPVMVGYDGKEAEKPGDCGSGQEYCFHKMSGITRNRPFSGRIVRPGWPWSCPGPIPLSILSRFCPDRDATLVLSHSAQKENLVSLQVPDAF